MRAFTKIANNKCVNVWLSDFFGMFCEKSSKMLYLHRKCFKKSIMTENDLKKTYVSLFEKHYSSLMFYVTRFVDEDEAEDIIQDVFFELWNRRDKVEFGDNIKSFLYRSAYTKALNVIKHKNIVDNYSAEETELYNSRLEFYQPDNTDVIKRIENIELRKEINSAINSLPEKCREIFKLSYIYNHTNKEIADVLGLSLRTVEAHMYKALKFLRGKLEHLTLFLILMMRIILIK